VNESASQGEFFLHPAGELVSPAVLKFGQSGKFQQPFHAGSQLGFIHIVQIGKKGQILYYREFGVKAELLRHVPDFLFDFFGLISQIVACNSSFPRANIQQTG
jgi:hypothetical protein